jgi:aspartyl-tRNA(Asn)/glutamyl-tRNA(Gln) amidotransferase subunit A
MTLLATGTDTGGSIRVPASYCGVVGLKPTFGLVSKYGVFPLGFSLDHPGPMGRTVEDAALMLEAMTGHDPLDASSVSARAKAIPRRRHPQRPQIVLPQNYYFEKWTRGARARECRRRRPKQAGATFVMGRVPDGEQLSVVAQVTC